MANIQVATHPIEALELPPASVDLVVSNYALHHLRDADKARLMGRCAEWLVPDGQIVIGDMMFGRGSASDDRRIIAGKVRGLGRRGPAGWWRLAKNIGRFGFRIREKPLPVGRWEALARDAGFEQVTTRRIVAEACVMSAVKPRGRGLDGAVALTPA